MPRDMGPDLLRNLDDQLAAGKIDHATYDTRRTEVLELIRKGKAVEFRPVERTVLIVCGIAAVVIGVLLLGGAAAGGAILGVLIGLALMIGGFTLLGRGLRGTK